MGGALARLTVALATVAFIAAPDTADAGQPANCPIPSTEYEGNSPRFQRGSLESDGVEYRYTVLLPSDYAKTKRRYPVLYLYHGGGGDEGSFMGSGVPAPLIETISADDPVIVVMPDGGRIGGHADWPDDPASRWETFHTRRLIAHIESTYRAIPRPARRAAFGFSMGGFGAMRYAARHPGLFSAAGSASGFPDLSPEIQGVYLPFIVALRATCTNSQLPFGPWGAPVAQSAEREEHNPTAHAEGMRGTFIYATSGNGIPCDQQDVADVAMGVVPDYTLATEAQIRKSNDTFHARLEELGIDHVYRTPPCGVHTYRYRDAALRDWWPLMLAVFRRDPDTAPALRLSVRPQRVRAGRRTRLRLRTAAVVDGALTRVGGALIDVAGRRLVTDARGLATLTARFRRSTPPIRASKPGFRPARTRIRVVR